MGAPHLRPRNRGHLHHFRNPQVLRHFAVVLVVDYRSAMDGCRGRHPAHRSILHYRHRLRFVDGSQEERGQR